MEVVVSEIGDLVGVFDSIGFLMVGEVPFFFGSCVLYRIESEGGEVEVMDECVDAGCQCNV